MAQFKFNDGNRVALDFNGVMFYVDPFGKNIVAIAESVQKEIQEVIQNMENEAYSTQIEKMMNFVVDKINEILADKDAVKKIFGDRTITFMDLVDVFYYIMQEISAGREKQTERFAEFNAKFNK